MSLSKPLLSTIFSLTLLTSAGFMLAPQSAEACGGFFCQQAQPVDQAGERILFVKDGEDMTVHVQIQYTGESENFSWLLPVPAEPKFSVGSDALFTALRNATRPQFNLSITDEGECNDPRLNFALSPSAALAGDSAKESVQVVSEQQVGPFDSVVLKSDDPEALKKWLRDNGYDIPDNLDPLLNPYINDQNFMIALKLQKDRAAGDLQPIVIKYKGEKAMIPIKLTAVAAQDDMDVFVWLLSNDRAIPENYRHAEINEARIDWLASGRNYRQVVTEAINEAGGKAFVTDYAGDNTAVDLSNFDTSTLNLSILRQTTDPIKFSEFVRDFFPIDRQNGRFAPPSTQFQAFLKRYIPKPESVNDTDESFYAGLENYKSQLRDTVVDANKAINELEETVIKPFNEIKRLFDNNKYLTALYSTISPEEMTVDPTFLFNPDLPKVSNIRRAEGVRKCSREKSRFEAPVEITLSNGLSFTVTRDFTADGGNPLSIPAAARVEQLKTSGAPEVITDNKQKIAANVGNKFINVNPSGNSNPVEVPQGFGCACKNPNTPVPISEGAEEGVSFTMMFLGWVGFRKSRKGQKS